MSEQLADDGAEPVVEALEVRRTFNHGAVVALDGVTFDVARLEHVAITGPSGCGKSTLLHLLAALDLPDSGTLRVAGEDISRLEHPNEFRRHRVGLVFQMHNLLPHLDALGNVGIAMFGTSLGRRERTERARELLDLVGLDGFGHRRPPELSGGERQRVALARAIANRPSVLIADEPTGSLDSASRRLVLELLERLRVEEGVTLVVVSHDEPVLDAADRVIHLRDGRVVDEERSD